MNRTHPPRQTKLSVRKVLGFNAGHASFWSPLVISILIALLSLLLFEQLADEMLEGETRQFDSTVRSFVHGFASPPLTQLMRTLTNIGDASGIVIGTTVACAVLWFKSRRNGTVLLAINTFGSIVLMWLLKLLLHRQRPEPYFGIVMPRDYSFPSGHALVAFCFMVPWPLLLPLSNNIGCLES